MAKDQPEKAREILATLHADGDASHPLVELEMAEMQRAIMETGLMSWRTYFDVRDLFQTKARRYRMMLNITFSWFGQFSGNKQVVIRCYPLIFMSKSENCSVVSYCKLPLPSCTSCFATNNTDQICQPLWLT
jgi:hypothetical protein